MSSFLVFLVAGILAAFCSGAETAFSAAGKVQVAARGKRGARALWFMDKPSRYLATTLVGTNVGVVLTSSISHKWGIEMGGIWEAVFGFSTALLLLLFSEITPKQLALYRSNRVSVASAPFLYFFRMVMYPLIAAATAISSLVSGTNSTESLFESKEEVRGFLRSFGGRRGKLASSVISMSEASISSYSSRLADFPGVDSGVSREEAVRVLFHSGEDLVVVWEETGVTLIGVVKGSSLVRWNGVVPISNITTGLPYFDRQTSPLKVLSELWRSGSSAAVILGENGQPEDLVTASMILAHLVPEQVDE